MTRLKDLDYRATFTTILSAFFWAFLRSASAAPSEPSSVTNSPSSMDSIEEIVVTAQKRSESIDRVGLSVTAISGENLERMGVQDIADLAHITPALAFSHTNFGTPVYTLRGVGFYETSLAAYPAVSVYVDEVPLPFPVLTNEAGLDLSRVEVLKGPQGILFGQNTTGGTINYIANKPTPDFQAGMSLDYSRFNNIQVAGFLSGPIADTVSARFAFEQENADGWQRSYDPQHVGRTTNGKINKSVARLLVDWHPIDKLQVEFNVNGWLNKSQPQAPQAFEFNLVAGNNATNPNSLRIVASPLSPQNPQAAEWSAATQPSGDESMGQLSVRADYNVTDTLSLTSITSYASFSEHNASDEAGLVLNDLDFLKNDGQIHSFNQELRLSNSAESALRWIVGSNYDKSTVNELDRYFYPDCSICDTYRALAHVPQWVGNIFFSDQRLRDYAIFGNVDYDVTPEWAVKAGARYTDSRRSVVSCNADDGTGGDAGLFNFIYGLAARGLPLIQPGGCVTGDYSAGPPVPLYNDFRDTLEEHNVSWRTGIDYKPSKVTLLYFDVTKGYKAGSFPTAASSNAVQLGPVKQESLLSEEMGIKQKLLDDRVSIHADFYHYNYADKQIRANAVFPVFGILNLLQNIPKSVVNGAELETMFLPVHGLRVGISAAYMDAHVTRYNGIDALGTAVDFSGAQIPFAPKWTIASTVDYSFKIAGSYAAFIGGTVSHQTESTSVIGGSDGPGAFGSNEQRIKPYTLLDLRAGVNTFDGKWTLEFWGKNVLNEYYWTNSQHIYDTDVRYAGLPATYGVRFRYRY